jgi:hypothetical protein
MATKTLKLQWTLGGTVTLLTGVTCFTANWITTRIFLYSEQMSVCAALVFSVRIDPHVTARICPLKLNSNAHYIVAFVDEILLSRSTDVHSHVHKKPAKELYCARFDFSFSHFSHLGYILIISFHLRPDFVNGYFLKIL